MNQSIIADYKARVKAAQQQIDDYTKQINAYSLIRLFVFLGVAVAIYIAMQFNIKNEELRIIKSRIMQKREISMEKAKCSSEKKAKMEKMQWDCQPSSEQINILSRRITNLAINEELINYLKKHTGFLSDFDHKLLFLFFCERIVEQVERTPNPDHFRMFEDDYLYDRKRFKPLKWIKAEIKFLERCKMLKKENGVESALKEWNKEWLTDEQVQILFDISISSLNRRIAEGLPVFKLGKKNRFYLPEISKWLLEQSNKVE